MNHRYNFPRTSWQDHFTNDGTGVTKFAPDQLERFRSLVERFGSKEVWIKDDCELHTSMRDLSAFWKLDRSPEAPKEV